ncbi:class I SAM-dependent methyltransferase [Pararhodonellum marinum]|uniref:class I SAM-dependent methyltransferase n=1 Tax=Pararhodonellum marinum TaxID=2755358 RepID=UPI0018900F10|nr:class I SAM-dependent methyltransferase [Pararhodonellum marinum]
MYSFKDYEKESAEILRIIKAIRPDCKTILDIGCGTSEHHRYLNKHFSIDGIDLNSKFIETSKKKNPAGHYRVENMVQFDLEKQYDVIICLFSSIGYLQTMNEIIAALKCFNKHLNTDGLVMVEPWLNKDTWQNGKVHMITIDNEDIKICRMNTSYTSGDLSILNFHYLVGTKDQGVQHFQEEHKLRLTSKEEMLKAFQLADFDVTFDEKGLFGRGMYHGKKIKI